MKLFRSGAGAKIEEKLSWRKVLCIVFLETTVLSSIFFRENKMRPVFTHVLIDQKGGYDRNRKIYFLRPNYLGPIFLLNFICTES